MIYLLELLGHESESLTSMRWLPLRISGIKELKIFIWLLVFRESSSTVGMRRRTRAISTCLNKKVILVGFFPFTSFRQLSLVRSHVVPYAVDYVREWGNFMCLHAAKSRFRSQTFLAFGDWVCCSSPSCWGLPRSWTSLSLLAGDLGRDYHFNWRIPSFTSRSIQTRLHPSGTNDKNTFIKFVFRG